MLLALDCDLEKPAAPAHFQCNQENNEVNCDRQVSRKL